MTGTVQGSEGETRIPFKTAFSAVDHSSSLPLNLQIVLQVDEAIRTGRLTQGSLLTSESDLCSGFKVARSTLRRAMANLEARGTISRERGRGKGTRIEMVEPISRTPGSFATVYEMIAASSRKPVTKVLAFEKIVVNEQLAGESGLPVGMCVIHILRQRSADHQPIAVLENWIDAEYIRFDPERLKSESLEALLQTSGVWARRAYFEFRPTLAGHSADFFGIDACTPVINEVRRVFDDRQQYEFSHHYSHPQNQRVNGFAAP